MKAMRISSGLIFVLALTIAMNVAICKAQLTGDVDGDGTVDMEDAILASAAFGSSPGDPDWDSEADVNSDDIVDIFDLLLIAKNFGQSTGL